jgi:hypothetical protein
MNNEWMLNIFCPVMLSITLFPAIYVFFYETVISPVDKNNKKEELLIGIAGLITGIAAMGALARTNEIGDMIRDLKNTSENTQKSVAEINKAINDLKIERKIIVIDRSFLPTSPLTQPDPSSADVIKFLEKEYGKQLRVEGSFFIPESKINDVAKQIVETKDLNDRKYILQRAIEFRMEKD